MTTTAIDTSSVDQQEILGTIPGRINSSTVSLLVLLVLLGGVGFFWGLRNEPVRAWGVYLVNLLFFIGLAAAGVLFGAVMQLAKGHWGKGMHRIPQGFGAFLPAGLALFFTLYFGREHIFTWIGNAVNMEGHALPSGWFSIAGVFTRGGLFLALLFALAFAFMYYSLRPDAPLIAKQHSGWRGGLADWMGRGWRGDEDEAARSRKILAVLAPIYALGYVVVISGMAIDLIQNLEPGWISVLFPAYFFVGAWLCGLCGTAVMAAFLGRRMRLDHFASNQWHDLGKLIFAFAIFWAYLWFSQYLVIWYGNMPRETVFIEIRSAPPWLALSIAFFACVFVLPFIFLLPQKVKMVPRYLASVASLILLGFWLERFDMVMPSLWKGDAIPFGAAEILVTLGFLGVFGLCYAAYATTFPMIPIRESLIIGKPRTGPY